MYNQTTNKLTFLGVWMTPDVGETVSFVINDKTLVDCGTNLVGSLIKNKIDPTNIADIIITHSHGDHVSGLPTYLFYRILIAPNILGKESMPLTIWGTKNTLDAVKEYVRIVYGGLADHPNICYHVVVPKERVLVGQDMEFRFFATKHMPETIGFSTVINGKRIVYSGDTALCDEVMKHATGADVLIHDVVGTTKYKPLSGAHTLCGDISPELEIHNVKEFYPVHRLSIYKDNASDYLTELHSHYSGKIVLPNDGDVIEL